MNEGLKIQLWEIGKIIPYGRNPKTHPKEQIDKLSNQILAHGFDQPIVVDKNGVIIKGHGRLLAALKLGWTHAPVIVRDDLKPNQVRLARIADNKLADTPWITEHLKDELQDLDTGDIHFQELSGFSEKELELLFAPIITGEDGNGGQESGKKSKVHKCPECGFEFED
jgi:ParB-like chromosome segregation protein Spo0J